MMPVDEWLGEIVFLQARYVEIMIKKRWIILSGVILLIFLSPLFLYWWALSNLHQLPQPSQLRLTPEQELNIWNKEKEIGIPRVKAVTVYGYIGHFYCNVSNGLYSHECLDKYPGVSVSALAVRNQVAEQVRGKGNTVWLFTWAACSIWVTRNWDIHQILATYHEAYNT